MPHPNIFRFEDHPEARVFPRTSPAAIAAMSRRQGVRVLTDWASFLLERNGYDFSTLAASYSTRAPFQSAGTALYMFGVATGFGLNDIDEVLMNETALARDYRRLLTPIGSCAGGDLLAQVTGGMQLGNIVIIDQNVHTAFPPHEFERQARRKLTDDPGTVVNLLIRHGLVMPLADTLRDFFDRLVVDVEHDGAAVHVRIRRD